MMKFTIAAIASLMTLLAATHATANEQQCQKLQDDHDVIYASKGFCFKDPAKQARFDGKNCHLSKEPKFSEKEQQRLDQIKQKQKELNCK
ncbi:YARHG domain-containing protein [Acinetobacter sp. B51(2017)]|uniref:YARHG domain-containing protein n=1 Tax=Acinetobacter sp. B51(2017) TaxID=2060938 RepID=UPI000F07908C|nr:YARHG domain-containing protein [Acinetobacter sp. B51(2017)]